MAPLPHSCSFTKVLLVLCLVLVSFTLSFIPAHSSENNARSRRMLELENESKPMKKKISTTSPYNNQTKLIKSTTNSSKNQTKQIKTSSSPSSSSSFGSTKKQTKLSKSKLPFSDSQTKNKTKLVKPSSNPSTTITKSDKLTFKSQQKKLNPTPCKSSNSTKITSSTTKKSSDLTKNISTSSPKNKTTKATKPQVGKNLSTESKSKTPSKNQPTNKTTKATKTQLEKKDTNESKSKTPVIKSQPIDKKAKTQQTTQKSSQYSWLEDNENDLISGFTDLPSKFQETLLPDLEKISKTSQAYLHKANKEITRNFKPYVGNKYAPAIASIISFAFILIPLILVSLIFNKIKAYFSLQKLLIFIQVYLSIYFSILCLSSLITGLEPLKFFYATAQSTYVCLQVLQTLAYVLYLLMLLMYLILVFSIETGPTTKIIGLAQTIVGFAVGLHYYMTVLHRAVLHQPPKTSWKVHAIYATFFLVICLSNSADRRKKAYLVEGGEVEKKS